MRRYTSPSAVARYLRKRPGIDLIAIDGAPGSGKSTLAYALGKRLGVRPIHLDKFLMKRRGKYVKAIRWGSLRRALQGSQSVRLIEGLCALHVLKRLGRTPNELLYVQRMSHGRWADQEELVPVGSVAEHLANMRVHWEQLSKVMHFTPCSGPALTEEVTLYHAQFRPHEQATILYQRADA